MSRVIAINRHLQVAARFPTLPQVEAHIGLREWLVLIGCGVAAAMAVALIPPIARIPGHAILRATLPFAIGLALVPRRSSGTIMALGAGVASLLLAGCGLGRFQVPAVVSMLSLGPLIDLAMVRCPAGWRLHWHFILAGVAANVLAFSVRILPLMSSANFGGQRAAAMGWPMTLASFIACGFLAGAISAALVFRSSSHRAP